MLAFIPPGDKLPRYTGGVLLLAVALFSVSHGSDALAKPKMHTVIIEAMRFSPQVVEANIGDTVVWINKDLVVHTATAQNRSFNSSEIAQNRSWKLKVRSKGVFPYVCTFHPTMKGNLVVK